MNNNLITLQEKGWIIIPDVVDKNLIAQLGKEIIEAYKFCRSIQVKNGIAENTDGTVHHLLCFEGPFLDLLKQNYCGEIISAFFNSPYILNTYGGVINLPNKPSYVSNIHRDIRTFSNMPIMMNMLVMLDDFTLENGATHLLSGSHLKDEKPSKDIFYKGSERAVGRKGSILLFNSLLWHSGGLNTTNKPRKGLTLAFTKPFMKQQLDYPRFLGFERKDEFAEEVKQVIGYNSRVPTNLDEWYQPLEKRFYQSSQG